MLIYKDLFTGDELFSDTYPVEEVFGGQILKLKGKLVSEKTDVGSINIGANASEEAPDESGGDAIASSGVNIVLANRLAEVSYDKAGLKKYLLKYMAELKKRLEESDYKEMDTFKKQCQAFVMEVLKDFKEYQFYMGESMQDGGMLSMLRWYDEGPYMFYFKEGLEIEKV